MMGSLSAGDTTRCHHTTPLLQALFVTLTVTVWTVFQQEHAAFYGSPGNVGLWHLACLCVSAWFPLHVSQLLLSFSSPHTLPATCAIPCEIPCELPCGALLRCCLLLLHCHDVLQIHIHNNILYIYTIILRICVCVYSDYLKNQKLWSWILTCVYFMTASCAVLNLKLFG